MEEVLAVETATRRVNGVFPFRHIAGRHPCTARVTCMGVNDPIGPTMRMRCRLCNRE